MKKKEQLIKNYKELINICERFNLTEYIESLNAKVCDLEEPLKFMIVGEGKSGKSTLLNALVGKNVAEVDDEPKTWCINVYCNTVDEEFAELVYKDRIVRTNIQEAREISQRIGSNNKRNKKENKILSSDYDIQEIRWHVELEWPMENVLIIDTPGFNQVMGDAKCETINIDGVDGIKFEAQDGFDAFQHKADMLLWCLDADNVGDEEVQRKIESVPMDSSKIYGIVTKLDRKDECDRERIFKRNEKYYSKYVKQCLRSGLPMIFEDDDPEVVIEKQRIRKESVDGIRWCIDYLLKDNASSENIKIESAAQYLEVIKKQIISAIKSYLSFYYENYVIYERILNIFIEDQMAERKKTEKEVGQQSHKVLERVASIDKLSELWDASEENAEVYSKLLAQQISLSGMMNNCDRYIEAYLKTVEKLTKHAVDSVKWKDVYIYRNPEEGYLINEKEMLYKGSIPMPKLENVSVKIGNMGFLYKIMEKTKDTWVGDILKALVGGVLRNKAIEMGREAVGSCLSECETSYYNYIFNLQQQSYNNLQKYIGDSYHKQTGQRAENTETVILSIEKEMTNQEWYESNIPFYPIIDKNEVCFVQSTYFCKMSIYQRQNARYVYDWLDNSVLLPLFEERKNSSINQFRVMLATYNGTKKINMPSHTKNIYYILDDTKICEKLPYIKRTDWGEIWGEICNRYKYLVQEYENYCLELWVRMTSEVADKIVNKKSQEFYMEIQKGCDEFIDAWSNQLGEIIAHKIVKKEFYSLPLESDYMYYFQYYYRTTHMQDNTIFWINEYETKGVLSENLDMKFRLVAPDGTSLEEVIKRNACDTINEHIRKIANCKENAMLVWDNAVQEILNMLCYKYEIAFVNMDNFMRELIVPAWQEYCQGANNYGSHRIKDVIEYMKKCGKMPKEYIKLIDGQVTTSEVGTIGYCVFSNRENVYHRFMKWLDGKRESFVERWMKN